MKNRFLKKLICALICISLAISCFTINAEEVEAVKPDDVIAYAVFGDTVESEGMTVRMGDQNNPKVLSKNGLAAWVLDADEGANSRYIYVDIDDNLMYNVSDGTNIIVEIEYFDDSFKGSLAFEYTEYKPRNVSTNPTSFDGEKMGVNTTTELEIYDFGGSNVWRSNEWLLQNVSFNNSINGNDFRFGVYSTKMGYSVSPRVLVHSVKVRKAQTKSQIKIDVDTSDYAMNFFDGEPMKFNVSFDNSKTLFEAGVNGKLGLDVTYTLIGAEDGKIYGVNHESFTIKPNEKVKRVTSFNINKFGMYKLKVEAENKDKHIYSTKDERCAYIISGGGKIRKPQAGMQTGAFIDSGYDKYIKMLTNCGYSHFRLPVTGPVWITTSGYGENNTKANEVVLPDGHVRLIKSLSEGGISLLGFTQFNSAKQRSQFRYEKTEPAAAYYIPYTDEGIKNWISFNKELLRIEKTTGNDFSYEMGNEWNLAQPRDAVKNAVDTGKLYAATYPELKKEYPDMMIGGPTLSGSADIAWVKRFLDAGGEGNIDFFSYHPYSFDGEPITNDIVYLTGRPEDHSTVEFRKLLDSYGMKDIPIWTTESGVRTYTRACHGQRQQAAWNAQFYLQQMEYDIVERYYHFQMYDGALDRTNGERNFGCLDYKGTAKSQLLSLAAINILLYDGKFVSRTDIRDGAVADVKKSIYDTNASEQPIIGDTVVERFYKEKDGKDFISLMSNKGSSDVTIDLGTNNVTLYDMYGNPTELVSSNGVYSFAVTEEPIYVIGEFEKYEFENKPVCGVSSSLINAGYSGTTKIGIINNSGELLYARTEPMAQGKTKVLNSYSGRENDTLSVSIDQSPLKGIEPLKLELYNDKGIYYSGNIIILHKDPVTITAETIVDENMNWYLQVDVTNDTETELNGKFKMYSPIEWQYDVGNVALAANETKTINVPLPSGAAEKGGKTAGISYIIGENGEGTYINKVVDFAYARKTSEPVKIDGNLDEWTEGWILLNNIDQFQAIVGYNNHFLGVTDLWAKVAVKWDNDNFYFAAEVKDDNFINDVASPASMWSQDNIQLGIIYDPNPGSKSFEELSIGLNNGTPKLYRHLTKQTGLSDISKLSDYELEIVKEDTDSGAVLKYELRVSWEDLMPNDREPERNIIKEGSVLNFGCIINDSDDGNRKGFYFIGNDGIGNSKDCTKFAKMFMLGEK